MTPKKWRMAAATAMLCLFAAAFALLGADGVAMRKYLLATQIPTSLGHVNPRLFIIVPVFLLSIHYLGRWYCSLLCPAGLAQELFHRVGGLLGTRRLQFVRAQAPRFRLVAVTLATITGAIAVANFLDPVGIFGRLAVPAGNAARYLAGEPAEAFPSDPLAWAFLAVSVVLLAVVPLFRGRWFCDALCPIGALLGLASRSAKLGIRIDRERCRSCGQCEKICQTRCLDAHDGKNADPGRCVVCLDCLDVCKFDAVKYGAAPVAGRRGFLGGAASAAIGGAFVFSRELTGVLAVFPDENPPPVLPPGAAEAARHKAECIGCQACVLSCPVGVIQSAAPEMRPALNYDRGYCQYGCADCNSSCPAGVFTRLTLEEKQRTRIAKTTLDLNQCVVVAQGTACGACAEVCPTHAVRMIPRENGLPTIPDFDAGYCIGCGACYHVCPAEPRAFRIVGLARQETSQGIRPGGHEAAGEPQDWSSKEGELTEFPF